MILISILIPRPSNSMSIWESYLMADTHSRTANKNKVYLVTCHGDFESKGMIQVHWRWKEVIARFWRNFQLLVAQTQ